MKNTDHFIRKHLFPAAAGLLCLSLILPSFRLSAAPGSTSSASEDGLSWNLPLPADIPAGEKRAAVTYRPVHETVYTAGTLYVRSGPGSEYPILARLSKGEVVRRGAIGSNGWSQILYGNQECYANSTYLSVSPILPECLEPDTGIQFTLCDETLFTRELIRLRSGPGIDYAVVGQLTKGNGVHRTAVSDNGWSRIVFHDTEVYANTGALSYARPGNRDTFSPTYEPLSETVYAATDAAVLEGPGFEYDRAAVLKRKQPLKRTAMGNDGWSRVVVNGAEGYVCSSCLSRTPVGDPPAIETSEPQRPTPNSPFIYQYVAPENVMPHSFFTPVDADFSKPLPLIVSLHGALEIGEAPETIKSNFLTKEFKNWEYTGLSGFDAYIVCPQMTGYGYADTWCCEKSADNLFGLIAYLLENYNIDPRRISIEGHSLGGQGALYMAADPRSCFSAVVLVSAYHPLVPYDHITVPVRGYTGSPYIPSPREDWTSFNFMNEAFTDVFGMENYFMKNCSHYDIPMVALEEDADSDGRSDLIDWMISQQLPA